MMFIDLNKEFQIKIGLKFLPLYEFVGLSVEALPSVIAKKQTRRKSMCGVIELGSVGI